MTFRHARLTVFLKQQKVALSTRTSAEACLQSTYETKHFCFISVLANSSNNNWYGAGLSRI